VVNLKNIINQTESGGTWTRTNLFQEPSFLDDIGYSLLTDTSRFVDVFEGIEFFGALMLDHPHLVHDIFSTA
jgi:hypothetical protein